MAGRSDDLATMIFWGGETVKRGEPGGCLDYTQPPMAMCFLSRRSLHLRDLTAKVRAAAMYHADIKRELNGAGLALFGRYPMRVLGEKVTFLSIPLADDQSYRWFLREAPFLSKPLLVHATPSPSRATTPHSNEDEKGGEEDFNVVTLASFVREAYENAVLVRSSREALVEMCYQVDRIMASSPPGDAKTEGGAFSRLLIGLCQEGFEGGFGRRFGSVKLVGELYRRKIINGSTVLGCIVKLLECSRRPGGVDDAEDEALCDMMYADEGVDEKHRAEMKELSERADLSERVRKMLSHLAGTRKKKRKRPEIGLPTGSVGGGEVQVLVKTVSGKTITVWVDPSTHTVAELKKKIKEKDKEGVPAAEEQGLAFGGHRLEDGRRLDHYKIRKASTVIVHVRVPASTCLPMKEAQLRKGF